MFGMFNSSPSHDGRSRVEKGAVLLDVRTREEFAEGHVKGALNIPVQELGTRLQELKPKASIVVYCRSGGRSAMATQMLRAAGHEVLDVGAMSSY